MPDYVDDNYDPDDPENYADVGEMVRQVTGDDPDTSRDESIDDEIEEVEEVEE